MIIIDKKMFTKLMYSYIRYLLIYIYKILNNFKEVFYGKKQFA